MNTSNSKEAIINVLLLIVATSYLIYDLRKLGKLKKLVARKGYVVEIIIIIVWLFIIFRFDAFNFLADSPQKLVLLKKATTHGLIALVIATLAYLDLTTPTFWFVVLIAYYIDMPKLGVY